MSVQCQYHPQSDPRWLAALAVGRHYSQHADRAGKLIPVPPWTRPPCGQVHSRKKWNSPQAGKFITEMLLRRIK